MNFSLRSIRNFITVFFIAIYAIFYTVVSQDQQKRTKILLDQQIDYLHENYKVSANYFKTISENTYDTLFSRPDVLEIFYQANHTNNQKLKAKLRKKLYDILKPHFDHLKQSGVNILLFSFPNNRTFLRVHKPSKFDDDLSKVRYSFTYVNKQQKPIRGFEQGKISHAFRNIKPLYYKGEFLGSVDLSFSSEVMQQMMRRVHGVDTHFILNKHVFDTKIWQAQKQIRYEPSIEHDDYLFAIPKQRDFLPTKLKITQKLKDEIARGIQTGNAFSLYYHINQTVYIISFSPIRNIKEHKTVAYLVSYVKSEYLYELYDQYMWWYILFFIGFLLVLILFYHNVRHRFLLQKMVDDEVAKNREKDFLVTQQARYAQMGEMISMIAHQWRQPLAAISSTVGSLQLEIQLKDNEWKEGDSKLQRIADYTQHLSTTIDDFRNFFKEEKEAVDTTLEQIIDESLFMIVAILRSEGITVKKEYECHEKLSLFANELKQVVLNILKNAQEAFQERKILNPTIDIKTFRDDHFCCISFTDNAGGIQEDVLEHVFDPYFTTKGSLNGTGLGLYMSKKIVQEHCGGLLIAENKDAGACFTIKLKHS
jgi:signal transduction histidine kinase